VFVRQAGEVLLGLRLCLGPNYCFSVCCYGEMRCRVSPPSVFGSCGRSSADPYGVLEFGWRDIRRYKQFRSVDTNISTGDDSALGQRLK
jgi:Fe-S-cluster-containing dehydrogenase component